MMLYGFFSERVTVGDLGVCEKTTAKNKRQMQWGVLSQAFQQQETTTIERRREKTSEKK